MTQPTQQVPPVTGSRRSTAWFVILPLALAAAIVLGVVVVPLVIRRLSLPDRPARETVEAFLVTGFTNRDPDGAMRFACPEKVEDVQRPFNHFYMYDGDAARVAWRYDAELGGGHDAVIRVLPEGVELPKDPALDTLMRPWLFFLVARDRQWRICGWGT